MASVAVSADADGACLVMRCRVIAVAASALVLSGCATPSIGVLDELEAASQAPIQPWCERAGDEPISAVLAVATPATAPISKPHRQDARSLRQRVDGQLPMALSVGVASTMLAALVVVLSSGRSKGRSGNRHRSFGLPRSMKRMFNSSSEWK